MKKQEIKIGKQSFNFFSLQIKKKSDGTFDLEYIKNILSKNSISFDEYRNIRRNQKKIPIEIREKDFLIEIIDTDKKKRVKFFSFDKKTKAWYFCFYEGPFESIFLNEFHIIQKI
ncbi:MAG: hypothetical protein WC414_00485 [Patescibacteria group bacterium]